MIFVTLAVPDNVAEEYYAASEKLASHLRSIGPAPDAKTLMTIVLASYTADDLARTFDLALRSMAGEPPPEDEDFPSLSS